MKPAALVLIAIGIVVTVVPAVVASITLRWHTVSQRFGTEDYTTTEQNFWGQPLRADIFHRVKPASDGDPQLYKESGLFPAYRRHGPWSRVELLPAGRGERRSTRWYIHGREVTREEWETGGGSR